MICDKCGKERKKGKTYKFHYGHGQSVRTGGDALAKEYTVTAVITGSDQAWICNGCVTRRVLLTFGLGSFLALGFIIALEDVEYRPYSYSITSSIMRLFGPQLGLQVNEIVRAVLSVVLSPTCTTIWGLSGFAGIYLLWQGFKEIGVVGENLAIKASRSRLEGYNLFANSRQYKRYFKKNSAS